MSKKKPDGYWPNWDNTRVEIEKMLKEHPELEGEIPGSRWMAKRGYATLTSAITKYHGGIKKVKELLGKKSKKKDGGYWEKWESLSLEVARMLKEHPELKDRIPTTNWMSENGYSSLVFAIYRYHGKIGAVRKKLGQESKRKERNYWLDWDNFKAEIEKMLKEHPELKDRIPTTNWMSENGYSNIHRAISKYHGGIVIVRKRFGQETKTKGKKYWQNPKNIMSAFNNMWEEHPELEGGIPSGNWMQKNGYCSLSSAISNYHGGIVEVRRKLGLEPNSEENELEELLRGYVEDE